MTEGSCSRQQWSIGNEMSNGPLDQGCINQISFSATPYSSAASSTVSNWS